MKAVIQRVLNASVKVNSEIISKIDKGFLILLGVEKGDTKLEAELLADKIFGLRVFTDDNDKMNLSLSDIDGEILVISNFTLCADCSHGRRPSFFEAENPEKANILYEYFCSHLEILGSKTLKKGVFGADMEVSLVNDGPVTIPIDSKSLKRSK